jgi:hypothetical protein
MVPSLKHLTIPIVEMIRDSKRTLFSTLSYLPELKLEFTPTDNCRKFEDFYADMGFPFLCTL